MFAQNAAVSRTRACASCADQPLSAFQEASGQQWRRSGGGSGDGRAFASTHPTLCRLILHPTPTPGPHRHRPPPTTRARSRRLLMASTRSSSRASSRPCSAPAAARGSRPWSPQMRAPAPCLVRRGAGCSRGRGASCARRPPRPSRAAALQSGSARRHGCAAVWHLLRRAGSRQPRPGQGRCRDSSS